MIRRCFGKRSHLLLLSPSSRTRRSTQHRRHRQVSLITSSDRSTTLTDSATRFSILLLPNPTADDESIPVEDRIKPYRYILVGKKRLPDVHASHEVLWGSVTSVGDNLSSLKEELGSQTYQTQTLGASLSLQTSKHRTEAFEKRRRTTCFARSMCGTRQIRPFVGDRSLCVEGIEEHVCGVSYFPRLRIVDSSPSSSLG